MRPSVSENAVKGDRGEELSPGVLWTGRKESLIRAGLLGRPRSRCGEPKTEGRVDFLETGEGMEVWAGCSPYFSALPSSETFESSKVAMSTPGLLGFFPRGGRSGSLPPCLFPATREQGMPGSAVARRSSLRAIRV